MIRTRIAQTAAVLALAVGAALVAPTAAMAAPTATQSAAAPATATTGDFPDNLTWG